MSEKKKKGKRKRRTVAEREDHLIEIERLIISCRTNRFICDWMREKHGTKPRQTKRDIDEVWNQVAIDRRELQLTVDAATRRTTQAEGLLQACMAAQKWSSAVAALGLLCRIEGLFQETRSDGAGVPAGPAELDKLTKDEKQQLQALLRKAGAG